MAADTALDLADALDAESVTGRITNHTGRKAATELRRLAALIAQMQRDAVQPAAVGEVNCFDKSGLPVFRLYPCAKNLRAGQEVYAAPHPEAQAAQPTQDERNLAAARLLHLLKPGHGLPNDFRLVPRQPEAQALDSARPVTEQEDRVLRNAALRSSTLVAKGKLVDSQLQQPDGHSVAGASSEASTPREAGA